VSEQLSREEVEGFWALGISLEARFLPDDEWQRALGSSRVQQTFCWSSMGTAETGWRRTDDPRAPRGECGVVPPGTIAEHTEYEALADDRDVIGVCWEWFWEGQVRSALAHLTERTKEPFLDECAKVIAELARSSKDAVQLVLVDALLERPQSPTALEAQLATSSKNAAVRHLVQAVRARWITHDAAGAFEAALKLASGETRYREHGNVARQGVTRMTLLRAIVRLARTATPLG